jgi:hypothetical protein
MPKAKESNMNSKNAPHGNKRRCREAPFFGAKQTGEGDVTTSAELTIGLDNNAASEIVEDKGLMSLGKTEFPGKTGVLDTGPSGGTSTAVVARDEDVVSLGFGDTGGDDADTGLRDELNRDTRPRAGALQIVDQLL